MRSWLFLWAALAAVAIGTRPLLPPHETRLLSVAWEMWQRGNFLVPLSNGVPYPEKPPLLFWMVHAGWAIFGVGDLWARLLPFLCGAATLWVSGRIAANLWPDLPRAGEFVPWVLLGCGIWVLLGGVIMTDGLLVACVSFSVSGLSVAYRGRRSAGFLLSGVALGLGILAKGPVAFVPVLPLALLLAPREGRGAWLAGVGLVVLVASSLALAWALPAARAGGERYANAILWAQTAGRIRDSFAHAHPWWWYLPRLPVLLLPLVFWPRAWRAARACLRNPDPPARALAASVVLVVATFSLVEGKQLHYVLPVVLPVALLLARGLGLLEQERAGESFFLVFPLLVGVAGAALPFAGSWWKALGGSEVRFLEWMHGAPVWPGIVLGAAAAALLCLRSPLDTAAAVRLVGIATVVALLLAHLEARSLLRERYDLTPVAGFLKRAELSGRRVGHYGYYRGQFHFLGRLERPLDVVLPSEEAAWFARYPDGLLVAYEKRKPRSGRFRIEFRHPYRGEAVLLVSRDGRRSPP
ncbi:MAG: hypothetical protein KatS3mg076_2846 [Candidatus Binatia bacterium]|nr:MAG: hypothetical protein KatS3mg076_2846 [Candidatus Binatia bacterium]